MAETVRENILVTLQNMLEEISIENEYRSDVASVQRYSQHGNSLNSVPCLLINVGPDKWDADNTPVIRGLMTVFIDVWIRQVEDDPTPTDTILNELIADIYECIWADTTIGGYAIDAKFISIYPFETIEGQPHAGVTIELEVMYRFLQNDPESIG